MLKDETNIYIQQLKNLGRQGRSFLPFPKVEADCKGGEGETLQVFRSSITNVSTGRKLGIGTTQDVSFVDKPVLLRLPNQPQLLPSSAHLSDARLAFQT